ncbi:MAG: hypothetical protein ABSF15_13680 [Candidatus Sulfotelmatobacter sp.]
MPKPLMIFVLLAASGLTAQEAKPSRAACRTDLKQWMEMFRTANEDPACASGSLSCPFVPAVRGLDLNQLVNLPDQIEACLAVDRHRRYDYQWTLSQTENLMVRRTAVYLISKHEIEDYGEWEDTQRGVVTPTDTDDPDTVARNR